jgi:hypothetical protein
MIPETSGMVNPSWKVRKIEAKELMATTGHATQELFNDENEIRSSIPSSWGRIYITLSACQRGTPGHISNQTVVCPRDSNEL